MKQMCLLFHWIGPHVSPGGETPELALLTLARQVGVYYTFDQGTSPEKLKTWAQARREAGFSKPVEVGNCSVIRRQVYSTKRASEPFAETTPI